MNQFSGAASFNIFPLPSKGQDLGGTSEIEDCAEVRNG